MIKENIKKLFCKHDYKIVENFKCCEEELYKMKCIKCDKRKVVFK